MPTRYEARRERPGLTEAQRITLATLAKRDRLTDYQKGTLKAFAFFGDEADARRAEKILRRHEKDAK